LVQARWRGGIACKYQTFERRLSAVQSVGRKQSLAYSAELELGIAATPDLLLPKSRRNVLRTPMDTGCGWNASTAEDASASARATQRITAMVGSVLGWTLER
jgi:hypothetical protein